MMAIWICTVCGFEYNDEDGYPDGNIEPGTSWDDIPEDFVCPVCGATKDQFEQKE